MKQVELKKFEYEYRGQSRQTVFGGFFLVHQGCITGKKKQNSRMVISSTRRRMKIMILKQEIESVFWRNTSLKLEMNPYDNFLAFWDYHESDEGTELIVFQTKYVSKSKNFSFGTVMELFKLVLIEKHVFEFRRLFNL